jgi:hypothetical protein
VKALRVTIGAFHLSQFSKRVNRTFEDLVRRILKPNPSLTASFTQSRQIDTKGRKLKKPFVPPEYGDLAMRIGMKPDTFYSKLDGQSKFWAHEAKGILTHLHDLELVNYFLEHTPFVASHRIDETGDEAGLLERLVKNALIHVADLTSLVDRSLSDRILNNDERDSLYRKVLELETAVAAVRAQFEDPAKSDPNEKLMAPHPDY